MHYKFESNRFISVRTKAKLPQLSFLSCTLIVGKISISFDKPRGCGSMQHFIEIDGEIFEKTSAAV